MKLDNMEQLGRRVWVESIFNREQKTKRWEVWGRSCRSNFSFGSIKWYKAGREYVYYPSGDCRLTAGDLGAIANFVLDATRSHVEEGK